MGKKRIIRFLYINWIIRMTRQLHQRLTELILFPNRLSVVSKREDSGINWKGDT